MTRVKICGITSIDDALAAVSYGADALGFIFAESPRQIAPESASMIIRKLPPFVTTVGVFVGDDPQARTIAELCGLDVLQLHTGYTEGYVQSLSDLNLALGVRVRDEDSLKSIPGLEYGRAVLLEGYSEKGYGGVGQGFDWRLASGAKSLGKPLILSGGLNPDNIRDAVQSVQPYAVDVSSGVESAPGRKDLERVRLFIERAR